MTNKEKQAVTRIIFAGLLIFIVVLKLFKIHMNFLPKPPLSIMLTEVFLLCFILFLCGHLIKFIQEAGKIFKERNHG